MFGDHVRAALLQPALADAAGVGRGQGDLETTVAIKQRRRAAVELRPFGLTRKYGTLVPSLLVAKCCSICVLRSIEERRHGLQHFRLLADFRQRQRARRR
jgi:hypothetical protein